MQRYEKLSSLGEGQFTSVLKARDRETGKIVSVKRIKLENESASVDYQNRSFLKEIKLLKELKHVNIIQLLDIVECGSNVSLVYEFMVTDLEEVIRDRENIVLTEPHIKAYMIMVLSGLEYLHSNWILHRDLNPKNLFIDEKGILKIGDLAIVKINTSPNTAMDHNIVNRWYKAPELIFGAYIYSYGIDIWAIGCIFAELFKREPLVAGETDVNQLSKIFEIFGTPNEFNWPNVRLLPAYVDFKPCYAKSLKTILNGATHDLLFVLESMLQLNPNKRCTCREALSMPYFSNLPYPTPCNELPQPQSISEQLKTRPDHLTRNACKRKILDDSNGLSKKIKKETVF